MSDKTHTDDVHRLFFSGKIFFIETTPALTVQHGLLKHIGLIGANKLISSVSEVEPVTSRIFESSVHVLVYKEHMFNLLYIW